MIKANLDKQLMIRLDNKVGTLAEVSSVVASAGINMIAICAYAVDNIGIIMFVTEDNKQAKRLLKGKGYDVGEEEVIRLSIPNEPGALQKITQRIADASIDVTLIYGSVDKNAQTSPIVLVAEDNEGILSIIKMMS